MTSHQPQSNFHALTARRNRREALQLAAVPFMFLGAANASAQSNTPADGIIADGLVGDGVTDDGPAIQEFIDQAADEGRTLILPAGNYGVYEAIEARSGLQLIAYGATLITYIDKIGDPGISYPTFTMRSVTDVEVNGLSIDGRKDAYPHTEWKHGFELDNSARITLRDCHAFNCKGDGIILNDGSVGYLNEEVLIDSSMFDGNYRNGGTASAVRNVEFRDCVFSGTYGTPPMVGFDVEPDREDVICTDLRLVRCEFLDNGNPATGEGCGFNISFIVGAWAPQENVTLTDCVVAGNAGGGIDLYRVPKDVYIGRCDVRDNDSWGVRVFDEASGITIEDSVVTGNRGHGITVDPQDGASVTDVSIVNVTVTNNGQENAQHVDGVNLMNDVADVLISECAIEGAPRYGIYAEDTVSNVQIEDTSFRNNGAADVFPDSLDEANHLSSIAISPLDQP